MSSEEIIKPIKDRFEQAVLEIINEPDLTIIVSKNDILDICRFLHDSQELDFTYLSDLCGVDYLDRIPRFEVVYHLYSIKKNHRLRVKARVGENEGIISVESVWKTANWHEREAYDLLGIRFENHPDLRRILLPEDWQGHPLRKDYPLESGIGEKWLADKMESHQP